MKLQKTNADSFWYIIGNNEKSLDANKHDPEPFQVRLKRVTGEDDIKWHGMLEQGLPITRVCQQAIREKLIEWKGAQDANGNEISDRDVLLREMGPVVTRDIGSELLGASEVDPE